MQYVLSQPANFGGDRRRGGQPEAYLNSFRWDAAYEEREAILTRTTRTARCR